MGAKADRQKEIARRNTIRIGYWATIAAILGWQILCVLFFRSRTANPVLYTYDSHYPGLSEYEQQAAAAQAVKLGIQDDLRKNKK